MKIEIPKFDGTTSDPQVFLEWESNMEWYFEFRDITIEKQFKLAKLKLVKYVAKWLKTTQETRGCYGEAEKLILGKTARLDA